MSVTFNPSSSSRFAGIRTSHEIQEEAFRLQDRLTKLKMNQTLTVGDPALGDVDCSLPGLGQIVEITKVPSDPSIEEYFGKQLSCQYSLSLKKANAPLPTPSIRVNSVTRSDWRLPLGDRLGEFRSEPGQLLHLGDILTIRLPEHYGNLGKK